MHPLPFIQLETMSFNDLKACDINITIKNGWVTTLRFEKKLINKRVRVRISYYYAWLVVYIVCHLLMPKIQVTGS